MDFEEDVKDFLIECRENLSNLDRDMLLLEQDPSNAKLIDSSFRAIHNIKGTSGFFNFYLLGALTHVTENVLSHVREGQCTLDARLISLILETVDATRAIVESIEVTGAEGDDLNAALRSQLEEAIAFTSSTLRPAPPMAEPLATLTGPASLHLVTLGPGAAAHNEPMTQMLQEDPPPADGRAEVSRETAGQLLESTIRVDVGLLDRLMNLVGELVLARNQLLQDSCEQTHSQQQASQRLNLITSELQESVMKTRMQPINVVWAKLPRVVRDLAAQCGKKIRIEMEGAETELDKTIIEAIKDPLTHLVRNCCDHGIEAPDKRIAEGKKPEGLVHLRAYHEGGVVNIEITDDGAGINSADVKLKAVKRGLLSADHAARLSDREAMRLIFLPGFSTASQVTSISGRGVGMDVVKSNVEKIGGSVDLHERSGGGTTVRIKIPLTLAIIPGLIVTLWSKDPPALPAEPPVAQALTTTLRTLLPEAERRAPSRLDRGTVRGPLRRKRPVDRFIIPQSNLVELVRIEAADAGGRIESVQGTTVLHHRGKLIPLLYLCTLLGRSPARRRKDDEINIVLLQAEHRQFGLVVDHIYDTQEIVVKPVGRQLKSLICYLGATIMGDGQPALILDAVGLARLAGLSAQPRPIANTETAAVKTKSNTQQLLLFRTANYPRVVVPLSVVDRLEEIDSKNIEYAAGRMVLNYGGQILPLITLEELSTGVQPQCPSSRNLPLVVFSDGRRRAGLIVEQLLDIVDAEMIAHRLTYLPGLLGSAVVNGSVTDLLDLQAILAAAEGWCTTALAAEMTAAPVVLLESNTADALAEAVA